MPRRLAICSERSGPATVESSNQLSHGRNIDAVNWLFVPRSRPDPLCIDAIRLALAGEIMCESTRSQVQFHRIYDLESEVTMTQMKWPHLPHARNVSAIVENQVRRWALKNQKRPSEALPENWPVVSISRECGTQGLRFSGRCAAE